MPVSIPGRSGNPPQRPEMFEQWAPRFPKADNGLAGAIQHLVDEYKATFTQIQRLSGDETSTPGARLVRSAKTVRAKLLPLIDQLDAASELASHRAAQLEAKTIEAYNPRDKKYETVIRHAEIRAYVRSLPAGDRLKVIAAATAAGDEDTLDALASCQTYLSGLPTQMHQHVRNQLIQARAPSEAAALASIREQRQNATQLRDTMLQSVSDMVNFAKADEIMTAASNELA